MANSMKNQFNQGTGLWANNSYNLNNIWSSSSSNIFCLSPSNVGIQTENPSYPLDVNGSMRINNQNIQENKVLTLWDNNVEDSLVTACNFYGFGVSNDFLRYQAPNLCDHRFYSGPYELLRLDPVQTNFYMPVVILGGLTLIEGGGRWRWRWRWRNYYH